MKNCPTCKKTYPTDFSLCPRDGAALVEAGDWAEAAVIRGKYQILAKLGQGGMGSVYKAKHLRFDELRALKVMSPEVAGDPIFIKRFEQEAVVARRLQHSNAVRVEDFDETEDGRPFIVMEYIEGRSLKDLIEAEGPLRVRRVCSIIKQVASALDAAHRLGMIHRDIKPANIVLVVQGPLSGPAAFPASSPRSIPIPDELRSEPHPAEIAKVLDFGIAKLKEARGTGVETKGLTISGTGIVIGTPQYMSPEQAKGVKGDQLDGRSDVYSLGIVMYQMLSGKLPFKADTTMEILMAHVHTQPTPIGEAVPGLWIPAAMSDLVMRCLEKSPERRPASARVLMEELERIEREKPAPLTETQPTTPAGARTTGSTHGTPSLGPISPDRADSPALRPPQKRPREKIAPPPGAAPPAVARQIVLGASLFILGLLLAVGFRYLSRPRAPTNVPVTQSETSRDNSSGPPSAGQPESRGGSGAALTSKPALSSTRSDFGNGPASLQKGHADSRRVPPLSKASATGPPRSPGPRRTGPASVETKPGAAQIARQIKAAKTEGDLYYENGEYDNAISAYQNGLKVDPTNAELLQKIQKARNAKATEGGIQ